MFKKRILFFCVIFISGFSALAQINFDFGSQYRYLKGSEVEKIAKNWMTATYIDSGWQKSSAPFRYGDGEGGFVLSDMQNNYSTLYLRSTFNAQNISDIQKITFSYNFDDGFIIWINGKEAIRKFAPDNLSNTSFSSGQHESGNIESTKINVADIELKEGENLIAVQGFNVNLESSDFYFDLSIKAKIEEPVLPEVSDSLKVIYSHLGGFYTNSFLLKMDVPNNDYYIVYTIDGSNPQTSSTAIDGGKSKTISIDPGSSLGRAKTPCYLVRASLAKAGLIPSKPLTQTYIFIDNVIKQKHPGGAWPTGNVNGQYLDFEMDDKVTNSPVYKNQMKEAFLDIPSISVVTDLESLFDAGEGIYVNAEMHGIDWERFCSVELIDSKTSKGFNINAGLRIRGGWSRHDGYPKHAFRLFFREEYGASKLNFPLFGDEGVNEYDKIDLRTSQNYAWSNSQDHNTFMREVFSRDTQRDMGQPYTRSRYYHLYLNGMYWGLYQTQERSEARYAADYFGGQAEDYDVIKVNGDFTYTIEATDGNTDKWKELWEACTNGFSANKDYFIIEGKDQNGNQLKGAETLVDINNLIDYMILIFYSGNFDAPVSKFSGDQNPNNFYAINKRDDKTRGFIFFAHDAEHTMMIDPVSPGIGIDENRVEINNLSVNNFSKFHPQWLHQKLTSNAEYRQRFADRAYKHFFNNGVLTPNKAEERFMARKGDVEMAIIAESARWGDTGGYLRTKNDNWLPEIEDLCERFFPVRTDIVIDQLIDVDLYKNIAVPQYKINNRLVEDEAVYFHDNAQVNISCSETGAKIYITTDGSDPRAVGGGLNVNAIEFENNKSQNIEGTTVLNSRTQKGNNWSALHTVKFIKHWENYPDLVVTELNYSPLDSIVGSDTVSGKSFEFIEFKNLGPHAIDLSRLYFMTSIDFHFSSNAIVYPNQFYVIASSSKWFFERYGRPPSAVYKNVFNNSGEVVTVISDDGRVIFGFEYQNQQPWPINVDRTGYSLTTVEVYPMGNPNNPVYWRASSYINGSPFFDDTGFPLAEPDFIANESNMHAYPNPTTAYLFVSLNGGEKVNTEIYTLTGQRVFNDQLRNNDIIDLPKLNIQPGILLVKTSFKGRQEVQKILFKP